MAHAGKVQFWPWLISEILPGVMVDERGCLRGLLMLFGRCHECASSRWPRDLQYAQGVRFRSAFLIAGHGNFATLVEHAGGSCMSDKVLSVLTSSCRHPVCDAGLSKQSYTIVITAVRRTPV